MRRSIFTISPTEPSPKQIFVDLEVIRSDRCNKEAVIVTTKAFRRNILKGSGSGGRYAIRSAGGGQHGYDAVLLAATDSVLSLRARGRNSQCLSVMKVHYKTCIHLESALRVPLDVTGSVQSLSEAN